MDWDLHDLAIRPRVLIMVSREGHCLNDLLYRREAEALASTCRWSSGTIPTWPGWRPGTGCRSST